MLIHLLSIVTAFLFARVAREAALGGHEIPHGQQQSQIVLLAPHQDGTKQGQRCSHSTWSLNEFWTAFLWVYTSVFQPFYCSGTFHKFLRCSLNPMQWSKLQPHRTVVANFVPCSFGLFRRNPWQPLANPG